LPQQQRLGTGLVPPARFEIRLAKEVVRLRIVWIDLDGLQVCVDGFCRPLLARSSTQPRFDNTTAFCG